MTRLFWGRIDWETRLGTGQVMSGLGPSSLAGAYSSGRCQTTTECGNYTIQGFLFVLANCTHHEADHFDLQ